MSLSPHSTAWYDRLATSQKGYYYAWRSHLAPWHGEDNFREILVQHLNLNLDVLEIACAQGALALDIAPACRSVTGYDRVAQWIRLAQQAARDRSLTNTTFLHHDSSSQANGGHPHLPAADQAFDVLFCSKGPFHWIEEARRVGRPGAVLLMLVPEPAPLTPWTDLLPTALRWQELAPNWARTTFEQRFADLQLSLHSWWTFDVPEILPDPKDLYDWRAWGYAPGEMPAYAEVASDLEAIFDQYAGPQGLEIRHRRHIWKSVLP